MPCIPLTDSLFSPPDIPGVSGLAIPLPALNIPFPPVNLADLGDIFNLLGFILPSGTIKPAFEPDFLNDIYGAVNDMLGRFMPFLMLYKFFLPVLNLILCIIEILCALLNPFKLPGAMRKLFRQCIPEFLALFPFFALIIMIISLLLLMLALLEYLIQRILTIVEIIIQNIVALGRATQRMESDSIMAIVTKIGNLLCFLSDLFVIFGAILIIIQVIKALLTLGFKIPPCDSSDGSDFGCCTPDVCPAFIKDNDTIISKTGNFLYLEEVAINTIPASFLASNPGFPAILDVIREESWQFYDPNLSQNQQFINIVQAYDLQPGVTKVFFPAGTSYNISTSPSSVPYTMNFRFFYNPATFGMTDPKGPRYVQAINVIIQDPPTIGTLSFDNEFVAPFNGTLNLVGGVMTEDNGTPILNSQGRTIPLNTFIHMPVNESGILTNDGYLFSDLTYTFTINHEILLGEALITLGCIPEVAIDRDFVNTTIGAQFNINGANLAGLVLPDVAAAQACLTSAIAQFSQGISVASANTFQANMLSCLGTLQSQTNASLTQAITAGFDQYTSTFSLNPSLQFTTQPIQVAVILNESSGQNMAANLPAATAAQLAEKISATFTFGTISPFAYDGYSMFIANLTSTQPGSGTIKVAFNNNFISVLNNPPVITDTPSVTVTELSYTFIGIQSVTATHEAGQPIRDAGDVAREGSE